ncbi:hypothetical protein GCM10011511_32510 [Puia dinghuensis]|uniref:BZIP transcription factor n=2 Tax=Puia dinghuensis TaxID=1792502 RepID=A0A8J2XS58_9BACT|nr:hypothetical protein GCM10011511_32510 [Puia dinghuensis]
MSQWSNPDASGNIWNTNTGNVGIGTTSPTFPFHVVGSVNDLIGITGSGGGRGGIYIQNTNSGGFASLIMENNHGSFGSYGQFVIGGSTNGYSNNFGLSNADRVIISAGGPNNLGLSIGTQTAQPLVFGTNNAERMRIDGSTGKVGIGMTTPQAMLHVRSTGTTDGTYSFLLQGSTGNNTFMVGDAGGVYVGSTATHGLVMINSATDASLSLNPGGVNVSALSIYTNVSPSGNYATLGNSSIGFNFDTRGGIPPLRIMNAGQTQEYLSLFSNGNVCINTNMTDNGNKLQVNGNLWTTGLILPTSAGAGKVLTSDANGNATWQTASGSSSGGWSLASNSTATTDNVGIGTTTPAAPLEVQVGQLSQTAGQTYEMARIDGYTANNSQIRFLLNRFAAGTGWTTASTRIQAWTDVSPQAYIDFNPNGATAGMAFGSGSTEQMRITQQGNVLIGKTSQINSGYMLDVNGNGRFNQVVVNTSGADFVFDSAYHLPSLPELQKYVQANHHLPDIAPAAVMQQKGVDLGDNQTRLLQKVEELTLYLIQQDKEIKALKERNRVLESMEQRLSRLEQSLK